MIYVLIIILTLIGGVSVPINKYAVQSFSPFLTVFLRSGLAFIFILPFVWRHFDWKLLKNKKILLINSLFAANVIFFALGINLTSVLMSILIYIPVSIMVVVMSYVLFREKLNSLQIVGLLLSVFGMTLVAFGSQQDISLGNPLGNLFAFMGALSWSAYLVLSAKYAKNYSSQKITMLNFVVTAFLALLLLPLVYLGGEMPRIEVTFQSVASLVYTAIFSSILFFIIYQVIIKKASAFISSLVLYPPNILGIIISILIIKDKVNFPLVAGALLVFAGIFVATTYTHVKNSFYKNG